MQFLDRIFSVARRQPATLPFEIPASASVATAAQTLARFGVVVWRGIARDLVPLKDQFLVNLARAQAGDVPQNFAFNPVTNAGSLHMAGDPSKIAAQIGWLAGLGRAHFATGAAHLDIGQSRARIVPPAGQRLHGLHQDGKYVAERQMLTAWTPLTDAGVGAPGLEVVAVPALPLAKLKDSGHWGVAPGDLAYDDAIARFGAGNVHALRCEAGDSVIFDEKNYHRTFVTPEMTKSRVSIDFRVTPEPVEASMVF